MRLMMCLLIVTRTTLMFHFRYIDGVADGVFAILRIAQHEKRSTEPDHACVICNIDERSQEPNSRVTMQPGLGFPQKPGSR